MTSMGWAAAFATIALAAPPATAQPERAPDASAAARYCMRVEPLTGSLVERVRCWTRDQWAEQGVDVDSAWARDGVSVIEPKGSRA